MPYKSVKREGDHFISSQVIQAACVRYHVGEFVETHPYLAREGLHLTYFETLEDVRKWAPHDDIIFSCKIEEEVPLPPALLFDAFENGYVYPRKNSDMCAWPENTRMAKKIMLLEKIEIVNTL